MTTKTLPPPTAVLIHPAHPLMQAVTSLILTQHQVALKRGAVLFNEFDEGVAPKLLIIEHRVKEGKDKPEVLSKRLQFVLFDDAGYVENAGFALYCDLVPMNAEQIALIRRRIANAVGGGKPGKARDLVCFTSLGMQHFGEVQRQYVARLDKELRLVEKHLTKEIDYQNERIATLQQKK